MIFYFWHNPSTDNKTFPKKPSATQNVQPQSVKVSYSCMNSMSKIIEGHNERVTSKTRDWRPNCNSRKKADCKREGNCHVNNVVCKCDVTRPLQKKVYLGLAEREWKCCFYNHKLSFKHKRHSNKTTLSSYMWHLNSVSSETLNLKSSVLRCIPLYSNISEKYPLCLCGKLEIVTYQNQKELLSKWSELLCKCRHANKLLLKGLHQ